MSTLWRATHCWSTARTCCECSADTTTREASLPASRRFLLSLLGSIGARYQRRSRIIEDGQPRETITLTLSYGAGPLELNLHNQRSGPTAQRDQTLPEADQIVGPKWITDVRISFQLRPRVEIAVSGANLFDVYPDEWFDFKDDLNAQGLSMIGISRYPGALSPFGMNGRTFYLRVAYH